MKASTVIIIGLGAAAALFLVLRMRAPASGGAAPKSMQQPTARNSRQALERAAVNVGENLANKAVDWIFEDRPSVVDSLSV